MKLFTSEEIRESRKAALAEIEKLLAHEDIDGQFKGRSLGTHSRDRFIVTWKGNYHGIACEERLDLTDSMYRAYSGYKAIRVSVSLFHEKQRDAFRSIHEGLIKTGIYLCRDRKRQVEFFDKYVPAYNEKIKAAQQRKSPPAPETTTPI